MQKHYKLIAGLLVCVLGAHLECVQVPPTRAAARELAATARSCAVMPQDLLGSLVTSRACADQTAKLDERRAKVIKNAVKVLCTRLGQIPAQAPAQLPNITAGSCKAAEGMEVGSTVGGVELKSDQWRSGFPLVDQMLEEGEKLQVITVPSSLLKEEFQANPASFVDCATLDKLLAHQWEIGQYAFRAGFPSATLFKCIGINPLRFALIFGTTACYNDLGSRYHRIQDPAFHPWLVNQFGARKLEEVVGNNALDKINRNPMSVLYEYSNLFDRSSCILLEDCNKNLNLDCVYKFFKIPGEKFVILKVPGITVAEHYKDFSERFKMSGNGVYVNSAYEQTFYDTLAQPYVYCEGTADGGVVERLPQ